jgi:UPF0755 protein
MKKIVLTTALVLVLLFAGSIWVAWSNFINHPASSNTDTLVYEIAPGLSFRAVARDLESRGLVKNANLFILLAKIRGGANKMKVGEYALTNDMTPLQILTVILSGKSIERKLTISEGLSIFEVAEVFDQVGLAKTADVMKALTDKALIHQLLGDDPSAKITSLEGYLFPETYSFTKFTDFKVIIAEMVEKFKNTYNEVIAQSQIEGLTRHQIVTLASIIEKETGAPQERPMISSVFHNRLKKGMLLQTDPTIIYGKALESGKIEINITKSDLSRFTPYNTYVIKGLPPGPISNPGREALLAAVRPASSKFLYFVSHNEGTHEFSEDYAAHLKAVQKFQLDPKARAGKSWRDLSKKKEVDLEPVPATN